MTGDLDVTYRNFIVKIDKIGKTPDGKLVSLIGTELEVYAPGAAKPIDSWTTTGEPHEVKGLEIGTVYTLKETVVPNLKYYDADGNLIWATNAKKSVTLPDVVLNLGIENVTIMTANYDMTDTPCTDTKPEDAIDNNKMGDNVTHREVYDLSGRRVNQVNSGMYIINGKKVIVK